jgi:hypothetical protein
MPYIIENGQTRFVTQAEINAYNQANPFGSLPVAPAGGTITNITPNQAEIDNAKITVENGQSSLRNREQALAQAQTNGASATTIAELQQNVENQRRVNGFNEENLTSLQGQVPQQFLVPNTTSTSPGQTLTETYEPYSGLVTVPPGADPEVPAVGENNLVLLNTGQNLGTVDEFGFVEDPATGLNVLPEDIPAEREGNELVNLNTGEVVGIDADGFTETDGGLNVLPEEVPVEREGNELVNLNTGEVYPIEDDGFVVTEGGLRVLPEEVDGDPNALTPEEGGLIEFTDQGEVVRSAADIQGLRSQAQQQQTVRAQRQNKAQAGDWRVRLRLAPQSNYLYNDPQCGPVLWPLRNTDGVIFPYTPKIDTAYKAEYDPYNLTHSNYRGYFYKGSYIDAVNINALFTAQDTSEANYLLATIHFFRSATKMFYGQDAQRGSPPPLVYLSGLGDYQFAEHPCVISQFNYNLPSDVDYIRAQSGSSNGTNLQTQRDRQTIAGNPLSYALQRLATVGLSKGALPGPEASNTLGLDNPTYVPTKMDIQLTLLPIQSREQVSKQFSLKNFANGNLLKGGFW